MRDLDDFWLGWTDVQARTVPISEALALLGSADACPKCQGPITLAMEDIVFYCARCDFGGDIVTLVRWTLDLRYYEALHWLEVRVTGDATPISSKWVFDDA